jgi:hypothetical protein
MLPWLLLAVAVIYIFYLRSECDKRAALRRQWADYNAYLRLYMVAKHSGDPIAQDYRGRLIAMGDNALQVYTGKILSAVDTGAAVGSVDDIFKPHLSAVVAQIQLLANKGNDFKKDLAAFDAARDAGDRIADTLAEK